jgi:hypothetical protein
MKFHFCFSGKVISEFSLLNPQNNSKPLVTYSPKESRTFKMFSKISCLKFEVRSLKNFFRLPTTFFQLPTNLGV